MTQRQKEILLHMTGLDRGPEKTRYHFAAEEGGRDYDDLKVLERAGYVEPPRSNPSVFGKLLFFHVTPVGVEEALKARAEAEAGKEKKSAEEG